MGESVFTVMVCVADGTLPASALPTATFLGIATVTVPSSVVATSNV